MSHSNTALQITGLDFSYGKNVIIRDLNCTVEKGELLMVRGPSGVGKSSLLRLIAGLEKVNRGEISINGELVSSLSQHVPPEKRQIGFVFQDFALFPHLNVAQNVGFGLFKLPRREREEMVCESLAKFGLQDLGKRFPAEVSGGQQQRVALARALVTKPHILLLDEPFSSLDPDLRTVISNQTFRATREFNICTIYVSHDEQFDRADHVLNLEPTAETPCFARI